MSLELDPGFVASKVGVLKSDIAAVENNFVTTFEKMFHIETNLARKGSHLR